MILFFFMVSTTMRDQELLVRYRLPEATEVQKLEKKSLVSYIHIGPPTLAMQAQFGTARVSSSTTPTNPPGTSWTSSPPSATSSTRPTVP